MSQPSSAPATPAGAPYAVVAGGGTGGHVLQALAVARALEARGHPRSSIEMVGSSRGQEASLLEGEGFPLTLLPGRGIVRRLGPDEMVANAGALAGLAWATCRELAALVRRRPRVVVSVGGYASFPAGLGAVVLGIPLVLVNIDAVPGLVHRLLGRLAAASAVAFPGTPLPRAVVTGTAVRQEIRTVDRSPASVVAARRELGLPPDRTTVGVVGGSLGARRINLAVVDLARRWAGRSDLSVYHVTGWRDWEEIRAAVPEGARAAGAGDDAGAGARAGGPGRGGAESGGPDLCYRLVPFEKHMARLYEAADVLVCRAGAVTVAELSVAGVPAVLVPLPGAPGDHQTANARAAVAGGAAVVVPDDQCEAVRLESVVGGLLSDPDRLAAMSGAARRLGRPDAADRVAELVDAHAR